MRRCIVSGVLVIALGLIAVPSVAVTLPFGPQLSGRILIQVQARGVLWYVSPLNFKRYYLGTDAYATTVLKKLSLALSADNLGKLPIFGSTAVRGDAVFQARMSGRIVRLAGDAAGWYVNPLNRQRYALGDQPTAVLKKLGLGISDLNLKKIPVAAGYDVPKTPPKPVNGLFRVHKDVVTARGTYVVDLVTLDLNVTTLKVMTDTAQSVDCTNGCTTLPLSTYATRRTAVLAIHGTYFCPREYASCVGQTGSYFYPVFNSYSRVMVNSDRLKYTNQPLITFDFTNTPHYYPSAKGLLGKNLFSSPNLTNIRAALSNSPALIEAGKNVANPAFMDTKQRTVKSYRGAIGWKGNVLYLYIVRGATVTDSAAVAQALGLDYALNLDGGGSTAMIDHGAYILGPGRNLPNAMLITP